MTLDIVNQTKTALVGANRELGNASISLKGDKDDADNKLVQDQIATAMEAVEDAITILQRVARTPLVAPAG